jgi:hypothetical protein
MRPHEIVLNWIMVESLHGGCGRATRGGRRGREDGPEARPQRSRAALARRLDPVKANSAGARASNRCGSLWSWPARSVSLCSEPLTFARAASPFGSASPSRALPGERGAVHALACVAGGPWHGLDVLGRPVKCGFRASTVGQGWWSLVRDRTGTGGT